MKAHRIFHRQGDIVIEYPDTLNVNSHSQWHKAFIKSFLNDSGYEYSAPLSDIDGIHVKRVGYFWSLVDILQSPKDDAFRDAFIQWIKEKHGMTVRDATEEDK